MEKDIN